MSYYDFANKKPKDKKSRRHWLLILALFVASTALWLFTHRHTRNPLVMQNKVATIKLPSHGETLPLPIATTKQSIQLKAHAPKLEFYQLLKSPSEKTK